jgi:hypothetical protein
VYTELDFMSRTLAIMQSKISEMKAAFTPVEDPENHIAYLNYDHFTNDISSLRHDSWEAGLTTTLFEKLKDRAFRKRFTGWAGGRLYSKRKSRISTEMTHNAPFRGHKAPDGIKQYARRQP